jgi:hypothetical protein
VWSLVVWWVAFWGFGSLVSVPGRVAKTKPVVATSTGSIAVDAKVESSFVALGTVIM